jgi:hypothetical protein
MFIACKGIVGLVRYLGLKGILRVTAFSMQTNR